MTKPALKFPHISRIINAPFDSLRSLRASSLLGIGIKIMILATLAVFLGLNLFSRLPVGFFALESAKLAVMIKPNDFSSHLLLTQEYLKLGDMEGVKRELTLAENLNSQPITYNSQLSSVLGSSLSPLKIWQKIQNEPQRIKEEIVFWEKMVKERPNYRDAYLQLVILNYQIYENQKAKEYLNKALEIDPNFLPTQQLQKIIY